MLQLHHLSRLSQLRLGLPHPALIAGLPRVCLHDDCSVDPYMHHFISCQYGGGRLLRHNAVVDALLHLAKRCGAAASLSYEHAYRDNSAHSATGWGRDQPDLLIYDLMRADGPAAPEFVDVRTSCDKSAS